MTPDQNTKTIATTLDEPDYRAFGVIAAQRGISRAELARQLLVRETKRQGCLNLRKGGKI